MAGEALGPGGWSVSCRVIPAPALTAELLRRRRELSPTRSVGVTDLLDPRSAYWRTTAPVAPTPERRALMESGREAHVRIGHALAPARLREVRLRREGIVGQVDLIEDGPVEIKTTALPDSADALRAGRPSYIEQLGMYCALLDRSDGRLLLVAPGPTDHAAVRVYDGRFRDVPAIWGEMRRRADAFRGALARRDPAGLPRCPWKGRGCEFEAAHICDCTGEEPSLPSTIRDELVELTENAPASESVRRHLTVEPNGSPPVARRFRDLIYPRRAYYERTEPGAAVPEGAMAYGHPAGPEDLYRALSDLLESGPPGEMTREPTTSGEPLETVACFRGDPLLLKVTRAWNAPPAEQLLRDQPQYFVDLALRCAALGGPRGWLVLGYERSPEWEGKIRAFEVRWDPLSEPIGLLGGRLAMLQRAVATRDPTPLPACPRWMVEGCAYGGRCGCGASSADARANR
ncbi:MAG: hypothetical protein L3J91_02355 [Thermoplasmata archaeon]|nr:hypothetical protein [Thermoplasmata archaeon]